MWSFAGCRMYGEIVTGVIVTWLFLQQEKKNVHTYWKAFSQGERKLSARKMSWQALIIPWELGFLRQVCKSQHWQINTTNRVFLIDNIRLWHFTNQPLLGKINTYETWLGNATWGGRCHASPTTADWSVCPQRNAVACSFPVNNVPTANRLIRRRGLISSPGLAIKSSGRLGVWHAVGIHQCSHSHTSEYSHYTAAPWRTVEFLRFP